MDKAKRKAIIAGNWKMNKTASEAAVLVDELVPAVQDAGCEVVICTPYTDLVTAVEKTKGTNIHVAMVELPWPLRTSYCAISLSEYSRTLSARMKPPFWNSGCQ